MALHLQSWATKYAGGYCSAKPVGLPSVRKENIDFNRICCGISLNIMYTGCEKSFYKLWQAYSPFGQKSGVRFLSIFPFQQHAENWLADKRAKIPVSNDINFVQWYFSSTQQSGIL